MSSDGLTPVSYVVLGLIARDGPSTPYTLKAAVARGIAHFWPFPHSQIYSETGYLTGLGLLAEERERSGRRRRTFRLTDSGRRALQSWLAEPTSEALQIRSYAFLQLYFGYFGRPEDVRKLADVQIASLEARHREIGQMVERLKTRADRKWQRVLAEMYAELARGGLEAWKQVAAMASREVRASAAAPARQERNTARSAATKRSGRQRRTG